MKPIFNLLFMFVFILPSVQQDKKNVPVPLSISQQTRVQPGKDSSQSIRIINASTLKRVSAVVKDLSFVLTDSPFWQQLFPGKKGFTIYLYDVTCNSFEVSAAVRYEAHDTIYHLKLNRSNQRATDIALAGTLIHEIMHCVLLDVFKRALQQEENAIASILSFGLNKNDSTRIFNNDFFALVNSGDDGQHELISRFFYSDMVSILERFAGIHKKSFADKNVARSLAWSGLQKTNAYKELTNEEKNVIQLTILKEKGIDIETD
ncbi:MAG TPA: hypothetical protein VFU29_25220 [Chitinophagaceae bacterium]|nr:hypothetical protein [Chitinophagaceae bacterium]